MFQRIQTVWMIVALVLMCMFPFFPFLTIESIDISLFRFTSSINSNLLDSFSIYAPTVFYTISFIVLAISLFMYKKRMLQARLLTFFCILQLIQSATICYILYINRMNSFYLRSSVTIPIISLILGVMAIRRVYYDEALVRASSRIR